MGDEGCTHLLYLYCPTFYHLSTPAPNHALRAIAPILVILIVSCVLLTIVVVVVVMMVVSVVGDGGAGGAVVERRSACWFGV